MRGTRGEVSCEGVRASRPRASRGGATSSARSAELGERLPEALAPLARLAFNYRWAWTSRRRELFADDRPRPLAGSGEQPALRLLRSRAAPPLRALAGDADYVRARGGPRPRARRRPRASPRGPRRRRRRPRRVLLLRVRRARVAPALRRAASASLAGDLLKAASDLALPLVGVGLLYREGYFHQRLDATGWQHEYWTRHRSRATAGGARHRRGGRPLTSRSRSAAARRARPDLARRRRPRARSTCSTPTARRTHRVDRWITRAPLHRRPPHAPRAVRACSASAACARCARSASSRRVVHLNEGHAALAALRARSRRGSRQGAPVRRRRSRPSRARPSSRRTRRSPRGTSGTTAREMLEPVLGELRESSGLERGASCSTSAASHPGSADEPSAITPLALRTSRAANGVSRRHGEVARAMWQELWPGRGPSTRCRSAT